MSGSYNAIAGRVTSRELDGKKLSRSGAEVLLEGAVPDVKQGEDDASEIEASNGVIRAIDNVLMQPKA